MQRCDGLCCSQCSPPPASLHRCRAYTERRWRRWQRPAAVAAVPGRPGPAAAALLGAPAAQPAAHPAAARSRSSATAGKEGCTLLAAAAQAHPGTICQGCGGGPGQVQPGAAARGKACPGVQGGRVWRLCAPKCICVQFQFLIACCEARRDQGIGGPWFRRFPSHGLRWAPADRLRCIFIGVIAR
jgi:hypothetical protein